MMNEKQESKDALKATGTVGGGQIINIVISLVKTKIIAIILGPSGVGIVGLLTTATDMIRNVASFGLPFSGVRDISIADGKNDEVEVSRVIKVFNKWVLISAILGSFIALAFCLPLSRFLFSNDEYTFGIAYLSVSIFFSAIGSGFAAVIQGKRAISLMVKSAIISNLLASIVTVILYLLFKENGIVSSMIVASFINLIVAYHFYKKLAIPDFGKISVSESWLTAKGMIRIGLFTIIVSVFDQIMSLGLRAFIANKVGVDGVGLFTAANTIATMYLSIVLGSIGSDYYPKLASIHDDNNNLHKSVNTQLYIILLLASPIIVGMIGFGDVAIQLLYSDKFIGAIDILKWQILGDFFKIIAWPCGFVFLAKGMGNLYIFFSLSYTVIYMAIIYFGWDYFGFFSIGMSFFIAQFFSLLFTYSYSYNKFGIYITKNNIKVIIFVTLILVMSFCSHEYFTGISRFILSGIALLFSVIYSLYSLNSLMDISKFIKRILKRDC